MILNRKMVLEGAISPRDKCFFAVAETVARTSNYHGTHTGCCIVYKGAVISVSANMKTPAGSQVNNHAEVVALSQIVKPIDWTYTSMYVYKELKNGKPCVSMPCDECLKKIYEKGIPYLCYLDHNSVLSKVRLYY